MALAALACEIAPGAHRFVEHDSYVAYRYLRVDAAAHAARMVDTGAWMAHEPCSTRLLDRIRAGVCASLFTSGEFRRLFSC